MRAGLFAVGALVAGASVSMSARLSATQPAGDR
jgi:hypothetical protein